MGTVTIVKNTEFEMGWRFKTDPDTPKDLTGFNILVQIRPSSVLATWDQDSDQIVFDPTTGSVDLVLSPSVTGAMSFKKGVIDCLAYDGDADTDGDRSSLYNVVVYWGSARP
jgi:hypothetical protein